MVGNIISKREGKFLENQKINVILSSWGGICPLSEVSDTWKAPKNP